MICFGAAESNDSTNMLRGPKSDTKKPWCGYKCPAHSYQKPGRQCYDNFDDCACEKGYYKSHDQCVLVSHHRTVYRAKFGYDWHKPAGVSQLGTMTMDVSAHGEGQVTLDLRNLGHLSVFTAHNLDPALRLATGAHEYKYCWQHGGPLGYHIHTDWTDAYHDFGFGAEECGGGATGGHFDPTAACGPLTGNPACTAPTKLRYQCVPKLQYPLQSRSHSDSGTSASRPRPECEVGDLSGKHGGAAPDARGRFKAAYFDGAVAQHARTLAQPHRPRAFCARLRESQVHGEYAHTHADAGAGAEY